MMQQFPCALHSPCVQLWDAVTVVAPIVLLGLFFLARSYWIFDYYVVSAFAYFLVQPCRAAWNCIITWWQHWYWIRIDVNKLTAPDLYEAIFAAVTDLVVPANRCVHANAVPKFDRRQREEILVFENAASSSFGTGFYLPDASGNGCNVQVQYEQGTQFCVGRDRALKQDSCLTLWIHPRTPKTWTLIHAWMDCCVDASRKQIADRLDVFTLQQTSTDWIPEWKFSNSRALKSSSGQGLNYYISRPECDLIYRDAKDFMDSLLSCYLVHGA